MNALDALLKLRIFVRAGQTRPSSPAVVSARRDVQYPAHDVQTELGSVSGDELIPQRVVSRAKKAVAFSGLLAPDFLLICGQYVVSVTWKCGIQLLPLGLQLFSKEGDLNPQIAGGT